MSTDYDSIQASAKEAERLLITQAVHRRGFQQDDEWKARLIVFVRQAAREAAAHDLSEDLGAKADALLRLEEQLPVESRPPSFKCVAGHKACMAGASTISEKVLCGIALVICLAKEVIPLA